jgi:putrescine transport system ATP-binding protein
MKEPGPKRPLLAVERLTKTYGGAPAVAELDLTVQSGELFALLGASGSGKTTLLRLIAGLDHPDSGCIRINGADVTGLPAYERPVNTVFQSYALFPHMSVRSNVAFGLKQDRLPPREIETRVGEMLELVRMSAFADRRPSQLSGGERQRVAIARSLAKMPKLLLLDEPMAALDRRLREQTRQELAAIQKRIGITFILVTHDQEEAISLADRMAVMDRGRIVQIGTPREIYERPATRFVAGFIGETNLLEGQVIRRDGDLYCIRVADGEVLVRHGQAIPAGATVGIAVRPENLHLTDPRSDDNRVAARVHRVEYLGDASIVHAVSANGLRVRIKSANGGVAGLETGDAVTVSWSSDSCVMLTQ